MNNTKINYSYEQTDRGSWLLRVNTNLFSKEYTSKVEMLGALENTVKPMWYEALIDRDSFALHVVQELKKREMQWIKELSQAELIEWLIATDNIKEIEIVLFFDRIFIRIKEGLKKALEMEDLTIHITRREKK